MSLRGRAVAALREPWTLVLAGIGGGLTWAAGAPIAGAGVVAGGMLVAAAGVGALTSRSPEQRDTRDLRPGTEQADLMTDLDECLRNLRSLNASELPDAVEISTVNALTAADGARSSALQVAQAVDTLDVAIERADALARRSSTAAVGGTLRRLHVRRDGLLAKLRSAVDEVSGVYARLLELTATASTLDVVPGDDQIGPVNDSITALQETFAELEADAAKVPPDEPPAGHS